MSEFIADYDITVITESKLSSDVTSSSLSVKGYCSNRLDRNNHGGGVITYVKNSLKPVILYDQQNLAVSKGIECTVTKIPMQGGKKSTLVLGLYRPPNTQ